jgi:hypothetical protein
MVDVGEQPRVETPSSREGELSASTPANEIFIELIQRGSV